MAQGERATQNAGQFALEFPFEPSFAREEFLSAPSNAQALAMIERWPSWPDRLLLLVGPASSGKSHLAAIWARRANALAAPPEALPPLEALARLKPEAILVDGVDDARDETALFHLLNYANENNIHVLLTGRSRPHEDRVRLPDLLSRMRHAPLIEIGVPDEELIHAVLEKLFRDRQLVVEPGLADYLTLRLERSLDAARDFVRDLDREALMRGRRVTRVLAGELLDRARED
jgi:chromosomal replication initiation ATPase DnaA